MNLVEEVYSKLRLWCWVVPILIIPMGGVQQLSAQELPLPNQRQLAWQEAELGVVFHYDLHVFDSSKYSQPNNRIKPIEDYSIFNPKKMDMDQWVAAAKSAGATFAIFTATHETGFALFQSDYNPYCLKAVNWKEGKGDLVRAFVDACRKQDIKPGIYLGIRWNSFFGVSDFKVEGAGPMQKNRQAYYNRMVEGMLTEICTNYGELFEVWFDGGASHPDKGAPNVLPIVKKYQPNALFYHNDQLAEARWGGSESGTVGYPNWATFPYPYTGSGESAPEAIHKNGYHLLKHGDPDGKYWMPAMADAPLRGHGGRHEWFWEPGDEQHIYPLEDLIEMYYKSVGRNATLILGLTPDPDGRMPKEDVQRLEEFGKEIKRRFNNSLGNSQGSGNELLLNLGKEQQIYHIILQEEIEKGERIREFVLQAKVSGKWVELFNGQSIGHKLIFPFDEPILTDQLRIKVKKAVSRPQIKNFEAFGAFK